MFVVPSPHVLYSPAKGEKEEPALQSPGQLLASAFPDSAAGWALGALTGLSTGESRL